MLLLTLPTPHTDLRFTSYVINNLLFLTPERQLLYVTDATIRKYRIAPTHTFEHLACFFPGLLALGVHLLPLNHLDALGIDATTLVDDLLPADRRAYADLAEFNLADLHLWAAEGLAQTCYLTYADQPTGLGPEIVRMDVDPKEGGIRWMDAMRAWKFGEGSGKGSGGLGWLWDREPGRSPPGVRDINPWTSPLHGNVTVEALVRPARNKGKGPDTFGRDYLIQKAEYYLRPEVRDAFCALACAHHVVVFFLLCRQLNRCISYGEQPET